MPVSAVFENLEARASIQDIIEQFDITREDVNAVLEFAARSCEAPLSPEIQHGRCWFSSTMYPGGDRVGASRPCGHESERTWLGHSD
jgi:hypothetical protein